LNHVNGNSVSCGDFLKFLMLLLVPDAENLATPLVTNTSI